MARLRYTIGRRPRVKHLPVEDDVHLCVKMYAEEHDITITEATYILLRKALAQDTGLTEGSR